jgi:transcriptional regulator GlxA family with amidase domain
MPIRVSVVALAGVSSSSLSVTLDAFAAANRIARAVLSEPEPFVVEIVGQGRAPVVTGSGLSVRPGTTFEACGRTDLVVLPGMGMASPDEIERLFTRRDVAAAIRFLASFARKKTRIASSCSGVFVLAEAGLLDGGTAATTWWLASELRRRRPAVDVDEQRMVVESGRVFTAGAALAQMDLVLRLVAHFSGPRLAELVARYLVIDERPSQARYAIAHHASHRSELVERAERYVRAHLTRPIPMAELARAVGATHRTLARRMHEALGRSPLDFVQHVRVEAARHLLSTTRLSVDEVAQRVGYQSSVTLRRVLADRTGLRPSELRAVRRDQDPC